MNNEDILKELESLVCATEESLAIITGTISETSDPRRVLMNLCAGIEAAKTNNGQNDWRDRLMRSSLKIAALKARTAGSNDPVLQTLISNVLGDRKKTDQTH
ncbi:MAG TPA: hypothetical protein VIH29_11960 [Gallionella sp.]